MAKEKKMDQVILGLLSHESMTGYEIKKRMDTTLKLFWNASYGSIYPTLNALEKDKKVTKVETTENGRDKVTYTITQEGKDCLKEWLTMPVVKDELRYETLLKLFFGSEVGTEVTVDHIEDFEEKIKSELPFLKASVEQLKELNNEEAHQYYMLTAMFGEKVYETYLEWCKEAKAILKGE
jgi:DNA-binding PadR family transcriptional regulator